MKAMNEEQSLELAAARLQEFQNARGQLENALSEVEAIIARSEELRDSIMGALSLPDGASTVAVPSANEPEVPAKKAAAKKVAKKKPEAVPDPEPVEDPVVEDSVVDHLPSGETQDEVVDAGDDLDDWIPGDDSSTETDSTPEAKEDAKKFGKEADGFDFDEVQF